MKPENRKFLDDNRHHWITLTEAQYLRGLNSHEREGMQRVMAEEFIFGYTCDLWCPTCCSNMVLDLYRYYDDFLKKEQSEKLAAEIAYNNEMAKETLKPEPLVIPDPADPPVESPEPVIVSEEPLQVKANFPGNNKQSGNKNNNRGKNRR